MYKNFVLAGVAFVISAFCFAYFSFYIAYAAPDQELTYHGKLTDTLGLAVPNGTYSFTLTIYDSATGTGCLWTARGTCSSPIPKSLTVTDGVFTTTLGESGDNALNIDFSTNYYLGVTIDSNAEMTPRKKITPTGFALNANRLDGLTADNYINTSSIAQTKTGALSVNDDFTVNTDDLIVDTSTGRVGIGFANPEASLHVEGAVQVGSTADEFYTTLGENSMRFYRPGAESYIDQRAIGGSLVFRTSNSAEVDTQALSILSNGNVGVGTIAPSAKMHVIGTSEQLRLEYDTSNYLSTTISSTGLVTFNAFGTSQGFTFSDPITTGSGIITNNSVTFSGVTNDIVTGTNEHLSIMPNGTGNVGIGTTNPAYKLDVAGIVNTRDVRTQSLIFSGNSSSILSAYYGYNGYTNFSGGIGTGGVDRITNAQRITSTGNLTNIGSVQAGEMNLTRGGAFAAKTDYPTDTTSRSVATGDLNGDGKLDLAVLNLGGSNISVLMNNGDGTYAAKVDYVAGFNPYAVALGDFNGDSKLDMVVTNLSGNTVSIFINNGNGTFAAAVDYAAGSAPYIVAVGDVNSDGKTDLVVGANAGTTISVLLNSGTGTFPTRVAYTTATAPRSVAISDINGDGRADIVAANYSSTSVSVLRNNGDGTFAAKTDYTTGANPFGIAIGDLNGDGKADLAVTNMTATSVSVLLNSGTGTFPSKTDYATATSPYSVAMDDFTGDGKADLAVANSGSVSVSVFTNNGDGTFGAKVDYTTGTSPYAVVSGDFNGDGKADLAVANFGSSSVSILLNQPQSMLYAQASTGNIGIGDVTPDHKLDVAGNIGLNASGYVNFGDTDGTTGYGFRDNAGTLEFKNSAGSWTAIGSGGSTTFLGLTDTPSSYTANQYVRVNATGTGLEFVDLPADADTLGSLLCSSGQVAQWDGSSWVCVAMSGGGMAIGGAITSATAGSILFAGTSGVLQQDNTNFFWDDVNNRLGLGTSTPSAMLSIFGMNNKLRLSYDVANYADISVDNAGQLTMNASSAAESAMVIGTGIAQDTSIQFDGISYDYFSGIDDATGLYVVGAGMNVTSSATLTGPGTVTNTAGGTTVTGTNTKFLSTFRVGNTITIGAQTVAISAIASDTSMTTAAITAANTNATYTYNGGTKLSVEPSGNVGIGKADPEYALDVLGTGTTGVIARFNSTNATGCTLATNGTISCSSDERLKKNIADLNYGIGTIMSLRPTVYNWNYEQEGAVKSLGFIAQEVESVLPQLVNTDKESGYKQLNTIGLVPVLTRAIQDQQHLIEINTNNLTTKATATSLSDLQKMTDAQFMEVSGILQKIQGETLEIQEEANRIADIELDASFTQANVSIFNTLFDIDPTDSSEEAHAHIADLAINMQKILAIDPDQLVLKDHVGDISIAGIMTVDTVIADEMETTKLTIVDDKNETIGTTIICPEKKILIEDVCEEVMDESVDQSDGKSVKVITDKINDHATIFMSFESDPGASSWIEKERDTDGNFVGFTIKLGNAVERPVKINWWIVEMK